MSSESTIGVVFLSGVRHAASYLPMITSVPGVALRAIAEEADAPAWIQDAGRALADQYGVPYATDIDAVLGRDDVDLAFVCTEPTRHARLAERGLLAGKHVLIDKPMATSLDDCDRLIAVAAASPGHVTVMHRLYSPPVQQARAALDGSRLGLVRAINFEWLASDGLAGEAVENPVLVADRSLSGGGELMNFAVYPISYLHYLTGLEVIEVYAEASSLFFAPHLEHGVEDVGLLSLKLEHDVLATMVVGRVPRSASSGPLASSIRIMATHGTWTVDEARPEVEVWRRKERRSRTIAVGRSVAEQVIDEFIADIRQGRPPLFSLADGRAQIAVIEAAYRSLASGQPERVANRDGPV